LDASSWLLVQQGGEALVQGRFRECERLASEASRRSPTEPAPRILVARARREQGRASEAEVLVRALVAEHPHVHHGQALLGAVLSDLGRDGEARRQLDTLSAAGAWWNDPTVAALAAETAAALDAGDHADAIEVALDAAGAGAGAGGWCGSLDRHLGLLGHVLGRWSDAEDHFRAALDANRAAGAPVLLAHTQRDYSALLRARGDDGDWEQAIELLDLAATVYRRLDIGRLADEAEAVLRRSQDATPADDNAPPGVFRPTAAGWEVAFAGREAVVADAAGVAHLGALVAADGRPLHVLDLIGAPPDDVVASEYRARLADLDREAEGGADPFTSALARAEADLLNAELAALSGATADPLERARRLVALRIRVGLASVEEALPALGRHLRRSVRTGTFCLYEPERPARWKIGP